MLTCIGSMSKHKLSNFLIVPGYHGTTVYEIQVEYRREAKPGLFIFIVLRRDKIISVIS